MWKDRLDSIQDIVQYMEELDPSIDSEYLSEYLREFGDSCYAVLREIDLAALKEGESNNNLMDSSKQHRYNNKPKNTMPPLLIDESLNIIDGHHRYRAASRREDEAILVYQIISQ